MTGASTERHLTVNGLRLHVRETGDHDRPVAIVLHGIMGHAREWDLLAAALAPWFHVVAVDQRGHGRSDWSSQYTAAAMADDLLGLVDAMDVAPALVVGHSMGGMAALLAVARRATLTDRLVLLDVGPDSVTPEAAAGLVAWLDLLAASSYTDVDEATDIWLEGNALARPSLMRHYVEHALRRRGDGRLTWRFDAANLGRFVTEGVSAEELATALRSVTVPTLVVRGVHSPVLPAAAARRMLRGLPRGELVDVPDAGHDLGVEQPEAVAHAVLAFARRPLDAVAPAPQDSRAATG